MTQFSQPSSLNAQFFLLALLSALVLTGCAISKSAPQVVREVHTDTLRLSNVHYDSIYISQDKYIDRTRDTLLIKEKTIEYRYRFLRDTLYRTRIDTIPVVREVEVIREVKYVPFWNKLLAGLGGVVLLILLLFRVLRGR